MTTTPTSGAADLLDLIEAYAEARHKQGHSSYNARTAATLKAVKDALAAGQATAAQAQPVAESAEVSAVESNTAVARMQPRKIDECYGDCPTNPATCPNPCKFLGRTTASHGQAPAGTTEPTEQQILEAAEKAGLWPNTVRSWIPAFHRYHKELAKAQSAPARADSVQEDAARLDWLDQQCEGYGFQDIHEGNRWEISGPYANVRQAIDYERAARKQGENHGR